MPQAVDRTATGLGVVVGIGYEAWVSRQLSLGVLVRVQYFAGSLVADDADHADRWATVSVPSLLLDPTYQ